jgi:hypothetical protein
VCIQNRCVSVLLCCVCKVCIQNRCVSVLLCCVWKVCIQNSSTETHLFWIHTLHTQYSSTETHLFWIHTLHTQYSSTETHLFWILLQAGDSTFYIWMVQCMGSEHWGFKLLHINDPIYGVWVLGIQPFTYERSNVVDGWIPSTQTPYIGPFICRRLNPLHSDPIHWTINM